MGRRSHDVPEPPLEFIDDGLTEDERGEALAAWLEAFDRRPALEVTIRAAQTLAELRAVEHPR